MLTVEKSVKNDSIEFTTKEFEVLQPGGWCCYEQSVLFLALNRVLSSTTWFYILPI